MSKRKAKAKHVIEVSDSELEILRSALDSHAYWELSDHGNRNNGFVIDETESADLRRCTRLARKLERIAP